MAELVSVKNLTKSFDSGGRFFSDAKKSVQALIDVDFNIHRGETLGLVGESGCGKSTLGRCLLRLIEPTSGQIFFDGLDLLKQSKEEMRRLRRRMQIIFQDPYASLNPRMTVGETLREPLAIHGLRKGQEAARIRELLDLCGLPAAAMDRYPHEFSGGQRQRVCIARALAVEPDFLVCDEPVSALDVSIQAQILNLLMDLQAELNLTYLFISHDLKVVEHVSDRVAVMYLGRIAELADSKEIYSRPLHPYTQALFSAIPVPEFGAKKKRIVLQGDVPSPMSPPSGCTFHPRCPIARPECSKKIPELEWEKESHAVACFFPGQM